ncbi:hypothetical protein G6F57_012038 [Rhizopus arrhizus]|nr:hypothetical protein G6F57_012038 [Rhizopus arrhizus]
MGAWPRHPCRGHSRNRTHPAFDRFLRSAVDPRHAWMNLHRNRIFRELNEIHPRLAWIHVSTKVDTYLQQPEICRRWGGVGVRGVSRMDAAAKPPGMGSRRPRTPPPPRQPAECQLLRLLLPLPLPWLGLPWLEASAGAGRSPAEKHT